MKSHKLYSYVEHGYQKIQNRWMNFHLRLLMICTVVLLFIEIIMFFVVKGTNSLLHSYADYFLTYVFFPVGMCAICSFSTYILVKKTSLSIKKKQYFISYVFLFVSFIISWVHGGFIVALITVIFPIVFTVMYEDIRLTTSMTVLAIIIQLFTAFSDTFDFDKVINAYYIINLYICIFITLATWGVCMIMLKFMNLKKEVIINNDIRRYELQNQLMIDGLTNVGSRIGLDYFMEEITNHSDDEYCLVMLDIDSFKNINDVNGHLYGDWVLKQLGAMMKEHFTSAKIYRYGGDEFVLIFINQKYQNIEKYINDFFEIIEKETKIQLSAGAFIARKMAFDQMMYYADIALYNSKAFKGSRLTLYEPK